MAELGKAYVQIVPSAQGISGSISKALGGEAVSAGKSAGIGMGQSLVGSLGGMIKGGLITAGIAAIGKVVKSSLDAGSALQQSFGGLDTLYGEASEKAKDFAKQAASAGISANSWAEQAVSFGAALKQSLGGDATAAAETANRAILDMADNSAKMGTDIASIQTAYQGFAKQNYTMLDNLKLGYGGTKTEMERLIADAAQMTDVQDKLGISVEAGNMSFSNIANAISVVQENLGIAGVAAEEASTTFTGSFAAMKSAGTNLLADMSLGNDITEDLAVLGTSVENFFLKNLFPMIGNIFTSIPKAIVSNLPAIQEGMATAWESINTFLSEKFPELASSMGEKFKEFMLNLPTLLSEAIPVLIQNIGTTLSTIIDNIIPFITETLPVVFETIKNGLLQLPQIISDFISSLFPMIIDLLTTLVPQIPTLICTLLFDILPQILVFLGELAVNILAFLAELAVNILTAIGSLLINLVTTIVEKFPEILAACGEFLVNLITGIGSAVGSLVSAVIDVIANVISAIASTFTQFIEKGKELVVNIATGIVNGIKNAIDSMKEVVDGVIEKITETDWLELGINLIKGIADGIVNGAINVLNAIKDVCGNALDAVKDFFGIHSPSKVMADEVGKFIPAGIAVGIEDNMSPITEAMQDIERQTNASISANVMSATNSGYNSLKSGVNGTTNQMGNISINVYGSENQSPKELALAVEDLINTRIRQKGMAFA